MIVPILLPAARFIKSGWMGGVPESDASTQTITEQSSKLAERRCQAIFGDVGRARRQTKITHIAKMITPKNETVERR